jgi:hypothetical protein
VTQRVHAAADRILVSEPVGDLSLRGFARSVRVFNVIGLDSDRVMT